MSLESREESRAGGESNDPLLDLMQRAGRRPEAPPEDTEQVYAAALQQWNQTVRSEQRRRFVIRGQFALLAAVLLATLGLWIFHPAIFPWARKAPEMSIGVLEVSEGQFRATQHGRSIPSPQVGDTLLAGTVLETGDSRLAIRLTDGPSLRMDHQTRVRCTSPRNIDLEQGAVYVDTEGVDTDRVDTDRVDTGLGVEKNHDSAELENHAIAIQTSLGVVQDVGTQFEVRIHRTQTPQPITPPFTTPPSTTLQSTTLQSTVLTVSVRDGRVVLDHPGGHYEAGAGQALRYSPGQPTTTTEVSIHGPTWQWTQEILPRFEVEGRNLFELLAWVSKQGAWNLQFAGQASEERARAVALTGSIEGLNLENSLAISMLGSGLPWTYRLDDGVLWIEEN